MALMRKLFVLAVTTGMAKKAWDTWRGKEGTAAASGSGGPSRWSRDANTARDKAQAAVKRASSRASYEDDRPGG